MLYISVETNDSKLYVCLGIKDNDTKLIAKDDVHIIDDKFLLYLIKKR